MIREPSVNIHLPCVHRRLPQHSHLLLLGVVPYQMRSDPFGLLVAFSVYRCFPPTEAVGMQGITL